MINAEYIMSFRSAMENEIFDEKYKIAYDNPKLANWENMT